MKFPRKMAEIRCTICGSDNVEVRTFVKPNHDKKCSTIDFSDLILNVDNCYCCGCGEATRLLYFSTDIDVFGNNDLLELAKSRLKESYTPEKYDDDTIYGLAQSEFLRVAHEVCLHYGFDDDDEPEVFDEYDNDIRNEVYARINPQ